MLRRVDTGFSWCTCRRRFEAYVTYLVQRGHALTTIQQYAQGVEHFDKWLGTTRRSASHVDEQVLKTFLTHHLPRCRCPPPCSTSLHQVRTALKLLLVTLRRDGLAAAPRSSEAPVDKLLHEYCTHLYDAHGLAAATRASSERFAREFIRHRFGRRALEFKKVAPSSILRFLALGHRWSPGSMKVVFTRAVDDAQARRLSDGHR